MIAVVDAGVPSALERSCPACGAVPGQACWFRNSPDQRRSRPHRHRLLPPLVVFDIDGVLADMSRWEYELQRPGQGSYARWQAFFSHVSEATLCEDGADLVHAVVNLGHPIRYSTTRPYWVVKRTLAWISAQGLPSAWVYSRIREYENKPTSGEKRQPSATDVKSRHADEVEDYRGLAAFIDDEPEAVTHLRGLGFNAHRADDLMQLTTKQIHTRLSATSFAPRQRPGA